MGFWRGETEVAGVTFRTALTFNASRFVVVATVDDGVDLNSRVRSGSWEATATEVTATWVDGFTLDVETLTVNYTLEGDELSIQPLLRIGNYLHPTTLNVGRQPPWTEADVVGHWAETWGGNTWTRYFDMTYDADSTCAWQDRFEDSANPQRDRTEIFSGTCELDFTEHFLLMTVDMADVRFREPLEEHTIRIAFTRGYGEEIVVSSLWSEQRYAPLAGAWEPNVVAPHGDYYLWMNKR